jgi:hypothetical protein
VSISPVCLLICLFFLCSFFGRLSVYSLSLSLITREKRAKLGPVQLRTHCCYFSGSNFRHGPSFSGSNFRPTCQRLPAVLRRDRAQLSSRRVRHPRGQGEGLHATLRRRHRRPEQRFRRRHRKLSNQTAHTQSGANVINLFIRLHRRGGNIS